MGRTKQLGAALRGAACLLAGLLCAGVLAGCTPQPQQPATAATFAMDTIVEQTAYGAKAQEALLQVNLALAAWEREMSLYDTQGGGIARINAAAGQQAVEVKPETARLLQQAVDLSAQSGGAFAITVAPLTLAWGILSDAPRVPQQQEIDALLPLVDDSLLRIDGCYVYLQQPGMGIDLGGIAKGAACGLAADIYDEYGVESAFIWIGGNTYARGTKPDGTPWRVGFANPGQDGPAYIASFQLRDAVIAVSGAYQRYTEIDGARYGHIFDPRTGYPAESDIVSVGVIHADGATADFYSTTLYVQGLDAALTYIKEGGAALVLDEGNTLYVAESLREGFLMNEEAQGYQVEFVAQTAA